MPSSAKRRVKSAVASSDGDSPQARTGVSKASGAICACLCAIAAFGWHSQRSQADDTLDVLACAWEQCASAELKEVLDVVAAQASQTKATHGQDLPPQRAMWAFCLVRCLDDSGLRPSAAAVNQVAPMLQHMQLRNRQCAHESEWVLEIAANRSETIAKAAEVVRRCGLVRLTGLWEETDYAWMDAALEAFGSLDESGVSAWGRIEESPRRTEDVLVPREREEHKELWVQALSHFLSEPVIAGIIGQYYGPGKARLSYASWIAAPAAPASPSPAVAQPLHSDLNIPLSMVSVHLALHDVNAAMGPTSYCPGTHEAGGMGGETDPAGPAGLLELPFALRIIALRRDMDPCVVVAPASTPRGTVTIYDSALLHRGEPNRADSDRVLLNLNIASSQWGIDEENYIGYFKEKDTRVVAPVQKHLAWMRKAFDMNFFDRVSSMQRSGSVSLARYRLSQQ